MNPLTARFLAYRANPKAPDPIGPVLVEKPLYEHSGYLSNAETEDQRMGRLVDAMIAGKRLSPIDFYWQKKRRQKSYVLTKKYREKTIARNESREAFYKVSPAIIGGR